jgi:hypothetical protein
LVYRRLSQRILFHATIAAPHQQLHERSAELAVRNSEYGERIEQQSATIERTGREPRRGRTVIAMVWSGFGAQCRARS